MTEEMRAIIAAVAVGFVVGGLGERWLLWRRLADGEWVYRRLCWRGVRSKEATDYAATVAAVIASLHFPPLLSLLWFVRCHRRGLALLLLAGLVGVVVAVVA